MVFQIRDDLLDLVAVDGQLGKPSGQDLGEGIYTLPVLVALDDPSVGDELRTLLGKPLDEPEREKARALVAATRGVELALDEGARWAAIARTALDGVPEPALRDGARRARHLAARRGARAPALTQGAADVRASRTRVVSSGRAVMGEVRPCRRPTPAPSTGTGVGSLLDDDGPTE